jgi:hypothetical protein
MHLKATKSILSYTKLSYLDGDKSFDVGTRQFVRQFANRQLTDSTEHLNTLSDAESVQKISFTCLCEAIARVIACLSRLRLFIACYYISQLKLRRNCYLAHITCPLELDTKQRNLRDVF